MTAPALDLPVAILAGGLATRLRPVTEKIPKSLLPVAGRPFLEHQLRLLKSRGIQKAVLCVGYLGEMIRDQFGDGSAHGIRLEYSFDGPVLLGTGGAIRQALPLLGDRFFVLYGDSFLPIEFRPVAQAFHESGCQGLMTVFRNEGQYDTSNVRFENGRILVYDKSRRDDVMRHIDYGLSLFRAEAFRAYPADQPLDLANVMRDLLAAGQLAGFEVHERFYEIGSQQGLDELDRLLLSSPDI